MTSDVGTWVIVAHALTTAVMLGVIWTVQIVHYPLFALVPAEVFSTYERAHMNRIGRIVGPAMIAELATAAAIAACALQWDVDPTLAWIGVGLVGVNWVSTALVQGPIHVRLATGKDDGLIRRLVATNWVRTAAWSARAVIAIFMVMGAPKPGVVTAMVG